MIMQAPQEQDVIVEASERQEVDSSRSVRDSSQASSSEASSSEASSQSVNVEEIDKIVTKF